MCFVKKKPVIMKKKHHGQRKISRKEAKPKYKKISLKKLKLGNVIFYEYPPLISSKAPVVNFDLNEMIRLNFIFIFDKVFFCFYYYD